MSRPDRDITSPRVDIGVFADNGAHVSAPAVVSILFPTFQEREYRTAPDGTKRLHSLAYIPTSEGDTYADPSLWPTAPWRDDLEWDAEGRLTGLQRTDLTEGRVTRLERVPGGWAEEGAADAAPFRHSAKAGASGVLELGLR